MGMFGSLFGASSTPNLQQLPQGKGFSGFGGSYDYGSRTFTADNPFTATGNAANTALQGMISDGSLRYDPNREGDYTSAYVNARTPAMERGITQDRNRFNAHISSSGMGGNSGAILESVLRDQQANEQRGALQNQAIIGGQQLANQDLQRNMQSAGLFSNIYNTGFNQNLNAQNAAVNAAMGANNFDMQRVMGNNKLEVIRNNAENSKYDKAFGNMMGVAGLGMSAFGGVDGGGLFSKGGVFGG